jgi:hypothetical protein
MYPQEFYMKRSLVKTSHRVSWDIFHRTLSIKNNKPKLMRELSFHNLECGDKEVVRNLQVILKEAEQSLLKKELASELLLAQELQSDGMKIITMMVLLRQDCTEKSESMG